jgi:hypothetical protein
VAHPGSGGDAAQAERGEAAVGDRFDGRGQQGGA